MPMQAIDNSVGTKPRPVGIIQPSDEQSQATLRALAENRIPDAETALREMPDASLEHRAWRALITGLITVKNGQLTRAEPHFLQASALAFTNAVSSADDTDREMIRLAARALLHLGWVYRRSDRCPDAGRVHLASFKLRDDHGSHEELWESATELALDADVARQFDEGERWHRKAIAAAESATDEPLKKQATAWTHLSTSQEAAGKFEQSVESARTARSLWRDHDPGAATIAQADARLGRALLKYGEHLSEATDPNAAKVLGEAVRTLAAARDALLAFGPDYTTEAQSCRDQQDFATRLDESVRATSSN